MKHAYWTITCKTPGCGAVIVAKYIGEHSGQPMYPLPATLLWPLKCECGQCGKIHAYEKSDFTLRLDDSPPPPGFRSFW